MTSYIAAALLSLAVAAGGPSTYVPKYGVTVKASKRVDFAKLKRYTWLPPHVQPWPEIEMQVVAAVDRAMADVGFVKVASDDEADIVIEYQSMLRTDADVRSKRLRLANGAFREYRVATLMVSMFNPQTLEPYLRLRSDTVLREREVSDVIDQTVGEMFQQYPGRQKK